MNALWLIPAFFLFCLTCVAVLFAKAEHIDPLDLSQLDRWDEQRSALRRIHEQEVDDA